MQQTIVDSIDQVAEGVVSLVLRGATEGPLAPWEPGAHIDLALPNWLTRQYSLCGDPGDQETYRIAIRYDPLSRGGSEYIHRFLRRGRGLEVSLPRNHFALESAPEYLFLAGGIGITPLLPMMRAAVASGVPASLVYLGQSLATMPFVDELRSLCGERVRIVPTEQEGRPDLGALRPVPGSGALVYCCGPAPMLAAAQEAFPAERLRAERFQPVTRTFASNTEFEAVLARSGRTVRVPPGDSLLEALTQAGRPVQAGCREGICGSCELTVLDGEPEHRDDIGAPAGRMYACVSRARSSRLVLDL